MKRIVELPADSTLEIDPLKAVDDEDTSENAKSLSKITTIFLATLEAASTRVPNVIREICHHIAVTA
jgi:hypothetical protein